MREITQKAIPYLSDCYEQLCTEITEVLRNKGQAIVAIDGRCASGKTTLGERMAQQYGCTVFHMDDFYLRAEQRTEARMSTPGENVDYERFEEEILIPLRENKPVYLRRIIHGLFVPGEAEEVKPTPLVIVEGAYSSHPMLRKYYDYSVFLTIDSESQSQRILKRNGAVNHKMFVARWIPLEERYFATLKTDQLFNIILEGK